MDIDLNEPTRPQLSALLDVSSRWIGELRSKGEMPVDGATWAENLDAWIQIKAGTAEKNGERLKLEAERARLTAENADSKAMDNAERRKELASLPEMTSVVSGMITMAVARLMLVGALVAKSDTALRARIDEAISDALDEFSMTRVELAIGGSVDDDDAPDDDAD